MYKIILIMSDKFYDEIKINMELSKRDLEKLAKIFGINISPKRDICKQIINKLKKDKNPYSEYLLNEIGDDKLSCYVLINSLKNILINNNLTRLNITEEEYKGLLLKMRKGLLTLKEKHILDEALNQKYCYCTRNIYVRNIWSDKLNTKSAYNPYQVCTASIYKNRGIDVPDSINQNCKIKYSWNSDLVKNKK